MCYNRPLTNDAIDEDADEPKEASHLDYKYIKSYEGPLTKEHPKHRKPSPKKEHNSGKSSSLKSLKREEDEEGEKLIDKHRTSKRKRNEKKATKVLYSFERKKYGGIRMC